MQDNIKNIEEALKLANQQYQTNYQIILNLIKRTRLLSEVNNVEDEKIAQIIKILNENGVDDLSEITKIGAGTYSTVYKIKDKVLKIGLAKMNESIIKADNIVPCLLRTNLSMQTRLGKMVFGIEIQELVDMQKEKGLEDLYKIYESLRKEYLIWTDVKNSNVGYLNDKLVIVDTDSIYNENDENIHWFTGIARELEERYKIRKEEK